MKGHSAGRLTFGIISLLIPLLHISVYLPIWGGEQLLLHSGFVVTLFIFQLLFAAFAVFRIVSILCNHPLPAVMETVFGLGFFISAALTCFVLSIFLLEYFDIPWFPQQR